jgi:DNA-binding MarR family transcriptional regulator
MTDESRLSHPAGIEDLLLRRMAKIVSLGGGLVTRLCEGRFGITRKQWTVLAILARQPTLSWTELAARSEVDSAQLSRTVSALAARGLATKTSLPNRRIDVALTPEGLALYAELYPLAREINLALIGALDDHAAAELDRSLVTLHARAEQLSREVEVPSTGRVHGGTGRVRGPQRGSH